MLDELGTGHVGHGMVGHEQIEVQRGLGEGVPRLHGVGEAEDVAPDSNQVPHSCQKFLLLLAEAEHQPRLAEY